MKLYIRDLPQQQYQYQSHDLILSKNATLKPGDTWHSNWSDYHIDRVTYSKDGLVVYATKTRLQKARGCYKVKKKPR